MINSYTTVAGQILGTCVDIVDTQSFNVGDPISLQLQPSATSGASKPSDIKSIWWSAAYR